MENDDRVEALRSVRLVDLVGADTPLELSPTGYRGSCIHHSDPTRSLYVSYSSEIFHCFNCGFGGDAIKWTMRRHGIDEQASIARLLRSSEPSTPPKP